MSVGDGSVRGVVTTMPDADGNVIVQTDDGKVVQYNVGDLVVDGSSESTGSAEGVNETKEPEPVRVGFFGNIYNQFKGKAKDAIDFLLRNKEGEASGALHHRDIGDISVVYGTDSYGLAHIAKKHPEVLNDLQGTIEGMAITSQSDNRIVLESPTHRAVISKMLGDKFTSDWLLTAYEKKNPASASSSDIETEPEGKQNGTATLQNEISANKVSENVVENQGNNAKTGAQPTSDPSGTGATSPKTGEEWVIPTDAKGEPMYESASVEATINDIYNDPDLDEEEADAFVQAKIDGATKRIAQLEKKKPKMGESKVAFKEAKAKWQEQIEAERKSLEYWQGVQSAVPEMRRKERARQQMEADMAQREQELQKRAEEAQRAEERGRNRGDYRKAMTQWEDAPSSFHEYVAQALLVGDYKMRWNDSGSTRGLGSHTTGRRGMNRRGEVVTARNDESRAMGWLIDDRTGLSPEALADRLWNEYTGSYGEDMAEGSPLDVLLDVVTSMPTPRAMWEYVKGEHDARMEAEQGAYEQQYSEEEIEAMERDAMYREKYGVSEDEYWAQEAQWDEFIESRDMSAEELGNYNNFVAEERIKEENERRNQENAEDEQRTDNSESERGVDILPGEQSDNTQGNGVVAGEPEGVDGDSAQSNDVASEETELSEEDRQAIDNMPIPMLKQQIKEVTISLVNVSQLSDAWQEENRDTIERAKLILAYAKQELARKERLKKSNKWGIKVGNTAVPFEVVRKMFEEFNSNEDLAQLFEKVAKVFETLPIKVVFSDTIGGKSTQGWFSPTTGTLKLPGYFVYGGGISEQNKAETILHEMIHAVTTYALYINEKPYLQTDLGFELSDDMHAAIRQLKRIYSAISADKDFKGEYGATSVHEMVAELSNVQFREKLKKKGLWETIVDAIKQLFGIEPSNALEGAEAALEYMLNNFDRSQWDKMVGMGEKRGKQMRLERKENRSDVNRQDLTTSSSSQVNDRTKVKINPDNAKESLKKLAEKYQGKTNSRGFLTDLNIALGLTEIDAPSNYYSLELPNGDEATIRISNHNADAENADIGEKEVSIVIKSRRSRNTFNPKDGVDLTEYVYFKEAIKTSKGNVLSQIAESLSEMMDSGEYQDKSGIAKINPKQEERVSENSEEELLFRDGEGVMSNADVSMANDPIAKVMGKSQRSKKQLAKFAERERKAMRSRVAELTERLHLDNVEVIENWTDLSGRKAKAKGWYDTMSGKIVISLSNHTSVADVERTLLHEAVAHHGLRGLFGKQFDTFLDNVFRNAEADIRAQIVDLAKRNGWDFRVATEEYLASLAENTNFEALENNWGWWQKIKHLFMDMLESIGWDYKGPELSDNELRYLLWRSYENMVNPGRHRSILGKAEDVAKQYALGVGNYSADAETAQQVADSGEVYSDEDGIEAVNEQFNAELQQQIDGTLPKGHIYKLGMPSEVLLSTGFPNMPIEMSSTNLAEHAKKTRHPFDIGDIKGLVNALQDPIAVFAYGNKEKSQNVIVEMQKNGRNFLVGVHFNQTRNGVEVSSIRGIFPKDNAEWLNWIAQDKALYIDKERVQDLINQQRKNLADVEYLDLNSIANIIQNFENPIISREENNESNGSTNAERDSDEGYRVVTMADFHKRTAAVFVPTERPQREPDYISKKRDGEGVSSEYWYGEDENGEYVIRNSDHWSGVSQSGNGLFYPLIRALSSHYSPRARGYIRNLSHRNFIRTCYWVISKGDSGNISSYSPKVEEPICGKAYIKDFRDATEYLNKELKDWQIPLLVEDMEKRSETIAESGAVMVDNQENPIDEDGKLIVEKVSSIDDITDADFETPTRSIQLPSIPPKVDEAIGANGKPIVIKKNVFEKNKKSHKDLTPKDSRAILINTLYSPDLYGQNQKITRPYNWILIHLADTNTAVLVEVNENKDNVEIVNWHYINDDAIERKKKQAIREGGLSSHSKVQLPILLISCLLLTKVQ